MPQATAYLALAFLLVSAASLARAEELGWAYAVPPNAPDDPTLHTLPGSNHSFTLRQIMNIYGPADWFPDDHPTMPPIVAAGREPEVIACALCHYPNGKGRPENAGIAGLSKDYIVQQIRDFRNGSRHSANALKSNTSMMIGIAQGMTEEETQAAAAYFSSMPWTRWINVVETATVPTTQVKGGMHVRLEGTNAGAEPIGGRIIEMPEDTERTELLRDPRSGFVAYVPLGAVANGETLVLTGSGRTTPCATCHGQDLNGLDMFPAIRGRSPSYVARQLYDFQRGTRRGSMAIQMRSVVAGLSAEDVLNISAYLASLAPVPAGVRVTSRGEKLP